MKKIALSLAGVLAAAAFAPEASAVPVFARQTGMACSACHFQHFPLLNGFGRAFKAAGFTMVGSQEKVEGEHLSLPGQLNMGYLATGGYQQETTPVGVVGKTGIFVPTMGGEAQLFIGGKVNDFSGFLSEFGTTGPASAASAKLHIMPEVAPGVHAGVTLFSQGQGAAGVMEMLNTGATSIHRLMGNTGPSGQHIAAYSARQYVANAQAGTGAAVNVVADNFAVTVAKETNVANIGANTNGVGMPFAYIRAVGMFDLAGFDSAVGIQSMSGTGANAAVAGTQISRKATIIDGQMQGEMGGMPVGFYASYGTAQGSAVGGVANEYNAGTNSRNSFNVAAEFGVMPGKATIQVALRNAKNGAAVNNKDNAFMIGATYELSQNMEVSYHYTTQSGSAWNAAGLVGKSAQTLLLETLF